jgi:SnoaL-like domain
MSEPEEVRAVLQKFQDGYTDRDVTQVDAFMELFVKSDEIELVGVGATKRGGNEWFQGRQAIRDIVEGDWTYWGDVRLDVAGAKITVTGEVAWLSTSGDLLKTEAAEKTFPIYMNMMKEILENEKLDLETRLTDATVFGVNQMRDRTKKLGHAWPITFTAVLVHEPEGWRFHTIHWAMPPG